MGISCCHFTMFLLRRQIFFCDKTNTRTMEKKGASVLECNIDKKMLLLAAQQTVACDAEHAQWMTPR